MILFDILGWLGMIIVLIAYLLLSIGKIKNGVLYQTLNLIAAILMAIGLFPKNSWFAFALQVAWAIISIISLINLTRKPHKKPFK